jgi:hypothetical protein
MYRTVRWADVGCTREIIAGIPSEWADNSAVEYVQNELATHTIQREPKLQTDFLKSLKRVCMTTTGDQSWGTHPEHHQIDRYSEFAWLPVFLLALPNVEHYCQTSMLGPLAITNSTHKPTHPPKIATFHCLHPFGFWDMEKLPPVVLGSTNRYMSPTCKTFNTLGDDLDMDDALYEAFKPLIGMLFAGGYGYVQEGDHVRSRQILTEEIDGTVVEVYNFIQHQNIRTMGMTRTAAGQWSSINRTAAPSSDLARLQESLDSLIGAWKGKVFLKNKADCPPCSACGHMYS